MSRRSALAWSSSPASSRGARLVVGQQQLERAVGAVEAPGGVEPRREAERDRALVDPQRLAPRATRISARSPGRAVRGERAQPGAHEAAVLAAQRDDVGDRRDRDELELGVALAGAERRRASRSACASFAATAVAQSCGHG